MIKNIIIIILIVLAGFTFVNTTGMHVSFHKNHKTIAQRLELTKEQIAYEKVLREQTKNQLKPLVKKLDDEHDHYNHLVKTNAYSGQIIEEKKKIEELSFKYNEIHKNHMKKFEQILTKEQSVKFNRLRKQLFLED